MNGSIGRGVPVLAARSLAAGYGHIKVLHDVSIELHAGELVTLLGANGAGKTTTLLALAGELSSSGGEILWSGEPMRGPLHARAKLGLSLVPEERSVFADLSVQDNLRLGRGAPAVALEMFPELKPLLKRRAGLLSGGEQQMLTLARALAAEPKALLVDELSLGLAPLVVERLLKHLRELADQGLAILVVEQQVRNALSFADRAVVMRRGRIVLEGAAADLGERMDEVQAQYFRAPAGPADGPQSVTEGPAGPDQE
jgi:branched-chain amino acid transport system ATP-binding protein